MALNDSASIFGASRGSAKLFSGRVRSCLGRRSRSRRRPPFRPGRRPSMRPRISSAARRPIAARSMRTVDSAGKVCCGELEVAEADEREVFGDGEAARARFLERAVGEEVRAAEHARSGRAPVSSSCARPCRPRVSVDGAGTVTTSTSRQPSAASTARKPRWRARARASSAQTRPNRRWPRGEQVARDRFADLLVREADQHVDRRGRHVPGLDHGDLGVDEPLAHLGRVVDAGEIDRVRTPAQHRCEERILARGGVAGEAQQHLVARFPQTVGQRLDGVDEDRVGDRRHERRDEPRALGREAARRAGSVRSPCGLSPAARGRACRRSRARAG